MLWASKSPNYALPLAHIARRLECRAVLKVQISTKYFAGQVQLASQVELFFFLDASKAFSLSNRCLRGCLIIFVLRRSMIQQSLQYLVFSVSAAAKHKGQVMWEFNAKFDGNQFAHTRIPSRLHEGMILDSIQVGWTSSPYRRLWIKSS